MYTLIKLQYLAKYEEFNFHTTRNRFRILKTVENDTRFVFLLKIEPALARFPVGY